MAVPIPWGRTIVASDLRHDANAFTVLRWVLASSVMFSHAFDISAQGPVDPTIAILHVPISRLAVLLFFGLSGFLVAGSLVKRGVVDFAVARALRLIPGLWVMLIVTALIVGLIFDAQGLTGLVHTASLRRYIGYNALLLGRYYTLDGAFAGNRLPDLVNGSLWTIPQEVRCYVALAIVGGFGLLVSRRALTAGYIVIIVADLLVPQDVFPVVAATRPLAATFFFGVLLYLWREHVFLSWPLAAAAVIAARLLPVGPLGEIATALAWVYMALVSAILVPRRAKAASAVMPDYSYGIYIYGFPAQQVAAALGLGVTYYANALVGFLIVIPLAALSWHLIEKPALALKPRLTRATAIPAQGDSTA